MIHQIFPRIVSDPAICGGRPIIAGTRMRVSDVLELLASGASEAEILTDYPYLSQEDMRAALGFAASAADHPIVSGTRCNFWLMRNCRRVWPAGWKRAWQVCLLTANA